MARQHRTIAVIGMHRSGTSALMGTLEQAGVYIGDTSQFAVDNVKGNRESTAIMTLHEDLLKRNGGAWDAPVRKMQWDPIHRALLQQIIQNFDKNPLWGFKDPRTLLTLNKWHKAIPSIELVGVFRHPLLVAQSLIRRNEKTAEEALNLWHEYNKNLYWYLTNKTPFPLLEFSQNATEFNSQLKQLIGELSLNSTGLNFFDSTLRHDELPEMPEGPALQRCLRLYNALQDINKDWLSSKTDVELAVNSTR